MINGRKLGDQMLINQKQIPLLEQKIYHKTENKEIMEQSRESFRGQELWRDGGNMKTKPNQ